MGQMSLSAGGCQRYQREFFKIPRLPLEYPKIEPHIPRLPEPNPKVYPKVFMCIKIIITLISTDLVTYLGSRFEHGCNTNVSRGSDGKTTQKWIQNAVKNWFGGIISKKILEF